MTTLFPRPRLVTWEHLLHLQHWQSSLSHQFQKASFLTHFRQLLLLQFKGSSYKHGQYPLAQYKSSQLAAEVSNNMQLHSTQSLRS